MNITFDMSDSDKFTKVSQALGDVFKRVGPNAGSLTEYRGEKLYHPLQIALRGGSKSGKSSLMRRAARHAFAETSNVEETIKTIPSANQSRLVTVFARWISEEFEIRTQDEHALRARPDLAFKFRHEISDFDRPGIRVFEHPDEDIEKYCEIAMRIDAPGDGSRYLSAQVQETTMEKYGLSCKFLSNVDHLIVTRG